MLKKLLSVLLSILLLVNLSSPIKAEGETSVQDVDKAMTSVSNSLKNLADTASGSEVNSLASVFTTFMDVARTSGQILTAVNGSVTFLRLIGLVSDPTQTKLDGILSQLQVIDERLASMDTKLDNLTTMMSEIKASIEFNARTEKAILYEQSWRNFANLYMEDGMDKLMSNYTIMLRAGLDSWCNGSRYENNKIDNRKIIVRYKIVEGEYVLQFSQSNSIPSLVATDESYVVIPESILDFDLDYNVNTFNSDLKSAIVDQITTLINQALIDQEYAVLQTANYPSLSTKEGLENIQEADIDRLANDAVDTLVYRVAASKIVNNADFVGEVKRQFANYCSRLQGAGEGIDATLKTYFLTHAFEGQIKEDLTNFLDRMIILTGTYGVFVSNVLGMSNIITDAEKLSAISQMTAAIDYATQAKNNSITGNDNYCYTTGSILEYTTVTFKSSAELKAHYTMSNTTLKSYKGNKPTAEYASSSNNATPIGDAAMIILSSTLLSNGITPDHNYFNENVGNGSVSNLNKIVTGYSEAQNFSIDGKTKLHVKNAFGSYFNNNSTITSLPGSADSDDVLFRKKISGSLYDIASRNLTSNATLCALAIYGENHWYWVTDEGAFMAGPADNSSFVDSYASNKTGEDMSGVIRTHSYNMSVSYNILLSTPCEKLNSIADGAYNPVKFLEQEVEPCVYDASDYGDLNPNDETDYEEKDVPEEQAPIKKDDPVVEEEKVEVKEVIIYVSETSDTEPEDTKKDETDTKQDIDNKEDVVDVKPIEENKSNPLVPIVIGETAIIVGGIIYIIVKKIIKNKALE